MCSNVPSKSVVLCLQVPLDPDILYISHALLVKMFDWGFQFLEWAFVFFRPPAYLFAKKRTLNNELTKGGLTGSCSRSMTLAGSLGTRVGKKIVMGVHEKAVRMGAFRFHQLSSYFCLNIILCKLMKNTRHAAMSEQAA